MKSNVSNRNKKTTRTVRVEPKNLVLAGCFQFTKLSLVHKFYKKRLNIH